MINVPHRIFVNLLVNSKYNTMNDTGKLMMTLTAGFAAGVVAGILFAPEVGETTRETLKTKASEMGDELEKHYQAELDKLKVKVSELTNELKQKVEDSGIEQTAEEVKSRVADAAHDLKEKVANANL